MHRGLRSRPLTLLLNIEYHREGSLSRLQSYTYGNSAYRWKMSESPSAVVLPYVNTVSQLDVSCIHIVKSADANRTATSMLLGL